MMALVLLLLLWLTWPVTGYAMAVFVGFSTLCWLCQQGASAKRALSRNELH